MKSGLNIRFNAWFVMHALNGENKQQHVFIVIQALKLVLDYEQELRK